MVVYKMGSKWSNVKLQPSIRCAPLSFFIRSEGTSLQGESSCLNNFLGDASAHGRFTHVRQKPCFMLDNPTPSKSMNS